MMRRRALLAASQTGGGKTVNRIVLHPIVGEKGSLTVNYNAAFPVASVISIRISTTGVEGVGQINIPKNGQSGRKTTLDVMVNSPEIQVLTFVPREDDTYRYEVVIEY